MGKIVYLMGKSSSGKDTIFKELLQGGAMDCKTVVPYTTRPIRVDEENGKEYFFTDEEEFQRLKTVGRIIEDRSYDTVHGVWRYFTVDDGQICAEGNNYIMIGTLEGYGKMQRYFGEDRMLPVMIELDDGVRLQRALDRERKQACPRYEEMCRRFLADSEDFSEKKIAEAGITKRFYNEDLHKCLKEIQEYIASSLS